MNPLVGDLAQYLVRAPAVTAIIGTRCYPVQLPQGFVPPALCYTQIDGVRVRSVYGPAGKVRRRIQIDSWAATNRQCWTLADAVRGALDGFRGMMGSTDVGSVNMQNEIEFPEPETGTKGLFRIMQDYIIGHLED